ncbi:hypothetical protein TREES_T100011555 [Tupaia chinensis]|uniref:Uncharacterized protein n=1 Tax=Tupaia chinensis TaxID=246437 RepID=L9L6N6_TUPCH|nr:hypothetical protein TREES_T100011555 [Tupaia chinensis]
MHKHVYTAADGTLSGHEVLRCRGRAASPHQQTQSHSVVTQIYPTTPLLGQQRHLGKGGQLASPEGSVDGLVCEWRGCDDCGRTTLNDCSGCPTWEEDAPISCFTQEERAQEAVQPGPGAELGWPSAPYLPQARPPSLHAEFWKHQGSP